MENFINSQLELSAFFDLTPNLVCIAGVDGYFKKINAAFVKKHGFTEKELFEKPISAFFFLQVLSIMELLILVNPAFVLQYYPKTNQ